MANSKFEIFLEVLKDNNVQTGYDFQHFMSVIQSQCLDKGITDYEEVKRIWKKHMDSLYDIANSIRSHMNNEEVRNV